jgi:tartrate-resistant acid phosphatase type 5
MRRLRFVALTSVLLACLLPRRDGPRDGGAEPRGSPSLAVEETGTSGGPCASTPDGGPSSSLGAAWSTRDGGGDHSVRFIAVGDTGKSNAAQRAVGTGMGRVCAQRGCDFVVLLGDNFYPSGVTSTTDPLWQTAFVEPYASVDVPFYAVLGNHDYGGNGAGVEFDLPAHQIAYGQVNPKWRMPATHYRWRLENVEFFVADTNRSFFGRDGDATRDFDLWLPASTGAWKVVFGHHPYLSNGPHGNAGAYDGASLVPFANGAGVKSFLEKSVCGKADVYLCGHDHSRQWLLSTCGGTELIVSGGGANTTELPGSQPTHYQSRTSGFLYVVIEGDAFTGTFYDAAGVANYSRTLAR